MNDSNLGLNIKKLRLERKIEQKDLAAMAGISHSYLSNVEKGNRNPALKTLEKIAAALEVPSNKLLEREESGKNLTYLYIENLEKQKVREKQEEQGKKNDIINHITDNLKLLELRDLYLIDSLIEAMNNQ